ncbi:hypothetical protein H6P81_019942 [Aristolochia fimbriata]|uniref:Uncharacterized protein n=1 Tax=Aristolochia fimbriata TaxID=158543 RepID=A0AAV7DT53_ARIFI|nr:hypothetical protein H6P81_019942 [Aristolochia fimbriata]
MRLIDAIYLKRDELLRIYIAKATGYGQNVNPGNAPLVVVQLLDDECPEDFIKGLTLSVRSLLPEDLLLEQYEERNRLHLLTQFLDHFVRESSQDVFVHISLGPSPESGPWNAWKIFCLLIYEEIFRSLFSEDPDVHFKYIEAAAKTGQIKEFERVNPGIAPLVVGQLLADVCPEGFIKGVVYFHSLDSNNNPEHFLTTNPYYDSRVVAKYFEKSDPTLAVVAYRRGQCDDELINVTNSNSLLKLRDMWWREWIQSCGRKFLVPRMNSEDSLLIKGFQLAYLRARALSKVSAAVKGFMTADHPPELVELLEKIVLQNSAFSGSFNLQNLLILTVIKADPSKAMDYINQLDNFDGSAVGDVPVEAALNEEAFAIFKKFNLNVQAVNVLLDNL